MTSDGLDLLENIYIYMYKYIKIGAGRNNIYIKTGAGKNGRGGEGNWDKVEEGYV